MWQPIRGAVGAEVEIPWCVEPVCELDLDLLITPDCAKAQRCAWSTLSRVLCNGRPMPTSPDVEGSGRRPHRRHRGAHGGRRSEPSTEADITKHDKIGTKFSAPNFFPKTISLYAVDIVGEILSEREDLNLRPPVPQTVFGYTWLY